MHEMESGLIRISNEIIDWKTAIHQGVDLLVKNAICTIEYSSEIINSVLKFGPYFVLMPKLALAHAASGEYNKKNGLSLIIFKNSIPFSLDEKHNVNLLFTLSVKDANTHMELLTKFVSLFQDDKDLVDKIINSNDLNEIKIKLKELF